MTFPEPIPIEIRDEKCIHCGSRLWEYIERDDGGRVYGCIVCKGRKFLADEFRLDMMADR